MEPLHSDAELEKLLIGRWVGSSERETIDFTFEPEHHFKIIETKKGGEPSEGWGYWDVLGGALRIGTSATECEAAPMVMEGDTFRITDKSFATAVFRRRKN